MRRNIYFFTLITFLVSSGLQAQLSISGDLRPRSELYNGNNSALATEGGRIGFATQQRTRLNLKYQTDKLSFVFSPQMIHFWGQMPQAYDLLGDGAPGTPESTFSVFEAYGTYKISDMFSLKFGRQAISYADQRWFGALGWAASGRAHDAFVGKFTFGDVKLDAGLAVNQTKHVNSYDATAVGAIRGGYKSMQYAWLTMPLGGAKVQAMITNVTTSSTTSLYDNTLTLGVLPSFGGGDLSVNASAYYQDSGDSRSAYLIAADLTYKGLGLPLTLGVDIVSGDDTSTPESETWLQPFGTNHKFYGFMDFFYVGETPSFGLNDIYAKGVIKTGKKTKLIVMPHIFMTNQDFVVDAATGDEDGGYLGTEIDLIYDIAAGENFNVKIGYSKLFADDLFESYKAGEASAGNQWAWVQLSLTPTFLKSAE